MTSWQTFWCHDVLLTLSHVFDVMTNFLTLWRTLWRYDVLKLSWQHKHGHNQMHTNISEWWCGQTLCWVGITCVQKHTHNLYLFRPILKIILAIIEMHMILCAKTLCCPHQGCLLTSTYCTCIYIYILIMILTYNLHDHRSRQILSISFTASVAHTFGV